MIFINLTNYLPTVTIQQVYGNFETISHNNNKNKHLEEISRIIIDLTPNIFLAGTNSNFHKVKLEVNGERREKLPVVE